MEIDNCKDILASLIKYESWLIAIASALITLLSVYIGHRFTLGMQKNRAKALENGLNNEIALIKKYFHTLLRDLIDEFNTPFRSNYTGITAVDMSCIDALNIELIAVNKLRTESQREFLINIKSKLKALPKKDQQRDDATTWNESNQVFRVPTPATALLIVEVVEIISYMSRYLKDGEDFTLQTEMSWDEHAQLAFSDAEIEYSPELWEGIMRNWPHQ